MRVAYSPGAGGRRDSLSYGGSPSRVEGLMARVSYVLAAMFMLNWLHSL